MQRVEWRWQRKPERWNNAAVSVQSVFRGMKGRKLFKALKGELAILKNQRDIKGVAILAARAKKWQQVVDLINSVHVMNGELYLIKAKVLI